MANEGNQTNIYVNVPQQAPVIQTKKISKVVYILVCFFVGIFGVHRFLRGQIGIGILFLITGGGCGIAVLIDFIVSLLKLSKYPEDDYEFTVIPRGQWTR